jgi:hypothetical protein
VLVSGKVPSVLELEETNIRCPTAEAEYVATGQCYAQLLWMRQTDTTTPLSNTLQPPRHTTSTQVQPTSSPTHVFDGPITRSRAKKLQQEVHTLLYEFQLNTNENFMLPKSCILILLKFTKEEGQNISKANQQEELCPSQSSTTEPSSRNNHIF